MPQIDIFTFFGQVTWFAMAFVFYFSVVGSILLPSINRSIKIRDKKLAYQSSVGEASSFTSSGDGYSLGLKQRNMAIQLPQRLSVGQKSARFTLPLSILSKSRNAKQIRSKLDKNKAAKLQKAKGGKGAHSKLS